MGKKYFLIVLISRPASSGKGEGDILLPNFMPSRILWRIKER